jgi:sarcosine oxidase
VVRSAAVKGQVAVVGLGVMGACTLWRLAERGAQAVGFEQFQPGHALGASHGETRIIRTAYYEGAEYVPLAQASFGLWRELEAATGARLLTMTGALMIGKQESHLVAGALKSARTHGLRHELLDASAMARRYPQHRLREGDVALHESDAGVLKPEACVLAALRRGRDLGASVITGSPAPDLGELSASFDHVVVCAGAWLPRLLPGFRVEVERQVMTWFAPRDVDEFRPERFPVFMRETPEGGDRFGIPAVHGDLVKVGIHHEGQPTDIETLDRTIHDSDRARVEAYVAETLPGLQPQVVKASVCMYSNTSDRHFLAGQVPGHPNVTVLGGFSGHGFKFAPVLGDAAADLAIEGRTEYPIELFSPARALATA